MGTEAGIVLFVALGFGVSGVEPGDAVVEAAAGFAQGIGEGEADIAPSSVAFRNVGMGGLYSLRKTLDLVFQGRCPVGVGRPRNRAFRGLLGLFPDGRLLAGNLPLGRIEFLLGHS